jgi:hypothetical protein
MKRLIMLGLLVILLAGCVDYDEELWLNKKGSGRAKMVIGVLTNYANNQEINRYNSMPGIHLISKSIYRKKSFTYYKIEFKFDTLDAFNNLNRQISNADCFGRIVLLQQKDGTILMQRRIALGSSEGDDEIEQLIFTHTQENLKWHYKMHLPWKIIKANADPAKIDYKTNTVEWTYQTSYLWNKHQVMEVRMKKSLPWKTILLIGIGVIVAGMSFLWWRQHKKG